MLIYQNYDPGDLWEEMRKTPVRNAVFVQIMNDGLEEAKWVKELSENHQFIKAIVAGINFNDPHLEDIIQALAVNNPKVVGVRHIFSFEPDGWLRHPKFKSGLAVLEKYNLTFDLLVATKDFADVINLAQSFPRLKMVINHIAKPNIKQGGTPAWKEGMKLLASCPNVYCKVSGMVTEADLQNWSVEDLRPYVNFVVSSFGAARCMFGSDWPVCKMANASFVTVFETMDDLLRDFTPEDRLAIFGVTAKKFYNLKDLD